MELKQKRNSNRIAYVFGEDEVKYTLEDGSGVRSFSIPYSDISRDRESLEERNQWLGNVGLLWLALGAVLTVMSFMSDTVFRPSIWLFIGLGCYAVYWFRRTRFTVLPSEKGNLLVINDALAPEILKEIETRRADQFRREYDFVAADDTPEQQRKRYKWLHSEGALSDEDLQQRLAMIETTDMLKMQSASVSPRLLN